MAEQLHVAASCDVLAAGTLFLDLLYPDLGQAPVLGHEQWVGQATLLPGAAANTARAVRALGLSAAVGAVIGTGPVTEFTLSLLARESIATTACYRVDDWDLPVTVGLPWDGDRALITGGNPAPVPFGEVIAVPPGARAVTTSLETPDMPMLENSGALIFADVGHDPTGTWDPAVLRQLERCYAFTPNALEAQAYTRTDTPVSAAKALANRVPLAVVTCGAQGYVAVAEGELIESPGFPVTGNPTGAGDTFLAGLAVGILQGLDARQALELGALAAASRIRYGRPLHFEERDHVHLSLRRESESPC